MSKMHDVATKMETTVSMMHRTVRTIVDTDSMALRTGDPQPAVPA
eukprot:CAMPEP_0180544834 /NCGR_PEP_ID=MMETSP1036_2-20121128/69721_1 /TAXON_ID=632150 /ORGANISM="Azadinium spinosum, Strain 3D9" /LENGTH=44 /DNA_ID= /DNA_START= /DNA_END= /DNA_ORIENTATION=